METVIAVACAIGAAICFQVAMYTNKKAVADLPEVGLKSEKKGVLKAFLSNRLMQRFAILGICGAGLYVVAISMAPVSIVQPIVSSGVVLLAYLAIKNLGEKPRRIDFFAIGLNILGVVFISVSLIGQTFYKSREVLDNLNPGMLLVCVGAVVSLALLVQVFTRGRTGDRKAAAIGVSVGLMYGLGAVFAKLMTAQWGINFQDIGPHGFFLNIYLLGWFITFVPALVAVQAAFQKGMAVVVVPIFAGLAQLVPIIVGTVALGEPMPDSGVLLAARIVAYALIITGTIILSRRAEEALPGPPVEDELHLEAGEAPA